MSGLSFVAALMLCAADPASETINLVPLPVRRQTLVEWSFDQDAEGWTAQHNCRLSGGGGTLTIEVTGEDPYFHRPVELTGGDLRLEIRARSSNSGSGSVFWTTRQSPRRGPDKEKGFALKHDGQWHEYAAEFSAAGELTDIRLDPGFTPGEFEIDYVRLVSIEYFPLEITPIQSADGQVQFRLVNRSAKAVAFSAAGREQSLEPAAEAVLDHPAASTAPVEAVTLAVTVAGFPPVERTVFTARPEADVAWFEQPLGEFSLQVAPDGSAARIDRQGQPVAMLAPLVRVGDRLPRLKPVAGNSSTPYKFDGEGVSLELAVSGSELSVSITSREPCEGPVVRALGGLEGGLFAGIEYLERGERSSSKLDVETEEHLRFAPDPIKVTMPLMVFATDRVTVALMWRDMQLQPVYATPNFFDGGDDHRMSLEGERIEATLRFDRSPVEETIAWAVGRHGLPPLPAPPRSPEEQRKLNLAGLNGPLRTAEGWGHCVEDRWSRRPFVDMASTLWRLTGEIPELPELASGGAHIPNGSLYFVTGRALEWKEQQARQVESLIRQQGPDGSYRYRGEYARGHFEDTANGICARPAATMLEYAYVTGDRRALEAGLKTLDYMKRFRVPRGAQVWEVPLHTPDILASAYAVWAYVRGYELTGKDEYLREARRWALAGVPFVYLWGSEPVMVYGTPPVLGATNWRAPLWIGLPVQWCGLNYAYGLTMLAPYDKTIDWNHLARGILIAGEQMQIPDGPQAGLLPDSFDLRTQERRPWMINPCALVSVRRVLDGEVDFLSVAADQAHRVAAPFPVSLRGGKAHVKGQPGVKYQVLVDGQRAIDVVSQGDDVVSIGE